MNILRSVAMALSMFSRIPMPKVEWKSENMRCMLAALPVVGIAIGLALFGWARLCAWLDIAKLLFAAGVAAIPVLISGGVHMDGFCDTMDALSSRLSPERKKEILKDPHAGAFAIISFGIYILCYFALATELGMDNDACIMLGVMHVMSRTAGAILSSVTKSAHEGLLSAFTSSSSRASAVMIAVWFLLCSGLLIYINCIAGAMMIIAAIITLISCRIMAIRQFGGMSGDIAGFTIQLSEIVMLFVMIFTQKPVELL